MIILLLLTFDLIAFSLYRSDKRKAEQGKWRIPEWVLLLSAVPGGFGAWRAMTKYHHKTRKIYFRIWVGVWSFLKVMAIAAFVWFLFATDIIKTEEVREFFREIFSSRD